MKELLLKDLCSRMPYNTKIQLTEYSVTGKKLPSEIKILDYYMLGKVQAYCKGFRKDEVKPYLYPLSSMTPKQKAELAHLTADIDGIFEQVLAEIEFYHRHHIDYQGLIPLGLAIDATGLGIYD
jgi:hypothetical protein